MGKAGWCKSQEISSVLIIGSIQLNEMNVRDWFVLGCITAAWIASTVYLYVHPSGGSFATWAGLAATMIGGYRWIDLKDSKEADAARSAD